MTGTDNILFHVEETSDLPIWAQLRNRMAYLIKTGHLKTGEQLPSVRSLAAEAKINYNTVAKAYRDLELSGLIVSVRGRGMFVRKGVEEIEAAEAAEDALLENCIRQYRAKGLTYQEIRARVVGMIEEMENKAREAEKEEGIPQ